MKVSKARHLTVKILSGDFSAASKNSEKNLCCLLKTDIMSVIDGNKRNIPANDIQLFFSVLVTKFMKICHCKTNINASFVIYHKFL